MTEVVNVHLEHLKPHYQNLKEWCEDPNHVYIGRGGFVFVGEEKWAFDDSMWANPFRDKEVPKEERLRLFEQHIRHRIEREHLQDKLLSLKGKKLGCWCKPDQCHGDVLVRLVESYDKGAASSQSAEQSAGMSSGWKAGDTKHQSTPVTGSTPNYTGQHEETVPFVGKVHEPITEGQEANSASKQELKPLLGKDQIMVGQQPMTTSNQEKTVHG